MKVKRGSITLFLNIIIYKPWKSFCKKLTILELYKPNYDVSVDPESYHWVSNYQTFSLARQRKHVVSNFFNFLNCVFLVALIRSGFYLK